MFLNTIYYLHLYVWYQNADWRLEKFKIRVQQQQKNIYRSTDDEVTIKSPYKHMVDTKWPQPVIVPKCKVQNSDGWLYKITHIYKQ